MAPRVAKMYSADVSDSSAWSLSGYVARTSPFMSVRFGFFIPNQWWGTGVQPQGYTVFPEMETPELPHCT